jgi:hypothetical protein
MGNQMANKFIENQYKQSFQMLCSILNPREYAYRGVAQGMLQTALATLVTEHTIQFNTGETWAYLDIRAEPTAAVTFTAKMYASEPATFATAPLRTITFPGPLNGTTVAAEFRVDALQVVLTNNTTAIDRSG